MNSSSPNDDAGGMESWESDAVVLAGSVEQPDRFSRIYERHLTTVTGYLARRVGTELAEDLAAEVFVRAFRARTRFRADYQTARPWLLGIASHVVADHRRAERRRLAALQRLQTPGVHVDPDPVSLAASDVIRRLRRLAPADRDTLLLVVWGELSYAEAASALAIPVGTVRSRIARARRRLAGPTSDEQPDSDANPLPAGSGDINA